MIQRIQTLYLFLVVVVFGLLCAFPPIWFQVGDQEAQPITLSWALFVMNIAIAIIALVSIFLYKKRILQVRVNVFNVLSMIGYYAIVVVYGYFNVQKLHADWHINWSAGLPLVGVILTMMAVRAILKDEALVRAADRLR